MWLSAIGVTIALLSLSPAPIATAATLEDRVMQAAKDAVHKRTGFTIENIEIKLHTLRIPERYQSATGVRVTIPDYDDAIGPVTGKAEFLAGNDVLGSIPIPMRVTVYGDVLVTTRQVKRHVVITSADFERKRVDVTRLADRAVNEPDSVVGRWFTHTIGAGQTIDRRWVEEIPLVRRGDRITMEYGSNGVRVLANATAMEDGYRNQTIAVKTEYANRLLQAVVIDETTVKPIQ